MIPTSFTEELLHPDRVSEDNGSLEKLFVRLVYDLFREEHPVLSYHDGGGKDGAIDLWSDVGSERHVFECKQFGAGRKGLAWEAAQSSWKNVRKNLVKNLTPGHKCQPQYRPWFNSSPRIVRYTFIVSCAINPSPDRLDELCKNIKSAFEELSAMSSELNHLKDIVVDVVDWNALRRKLEAQPQVYFKWFSSRLPEGLQQFTQERQLPGFRRYQQEDVLPYYSLRTHLEKHPKHGIQDEDSLWKSLAGGTSGLVISGISGVGKSRLMMELGKLAIQDGWLVFETENVSAETINRASRTHSSQGILFLFDYLESLPAFRDISLHIAQLAGDGRKVRFIASARESFRKNDLILDGDSIRDFQHSPEEGEVSTWWNDYRAAAVEHISGHLGVEMKSDLSSNIPAVAVLESGLLRDGNLPNDVGLAKKWAEKHLSTLNKEKVSKRSLALLAAQCPLNEESYARLSGEPREAFVVLLNSGWIEARHAATGRCSYRIVHNYLADQIVLHWMETEGPRGLAKTVEIQMLLNLAYSLNTLGAVVVTMQRIVGKIHGFGIEDFSNLLGSEIAANREIWKMHRQDVLYTRLLSPDSKVLLLHNLKNFWHEAESESWFQLEIAVLAKAFANTPELKTNLPRDTWEHFEILIVSLASAADERNMLVTYGLRLLPNNDRLQQIAMDWLVKFADHFDATYIIRAWLDMKLPWEKVTHVVGIWLARYGESVEAQFVLAAWLRATGEYGVTRFSSRIMAWCEIHKTEIVAQNVYSAWLKAGGSTQTISAYVLAWLAQNGSLEEEPSFIIKRWLRAGGEATLILPYLKEWLETHGSTDSASYVYAAAIDRAELTQLIQAPMLAWINAHPTSAEAKHCLIEWLRAGHDLGLVSEPVRNWLDANGISLDAGEVIGKWLEAEGKLKMILPYAMSWVAEHIDSQYCSLLLKALLERENAPDEVLAIALRWLESRSRNLDAELVLSAWLRGHHDIKNIRQIIIEWCHSFPTEVNASYIYEQWLLAGCSHQEMSQNIMAWIEKHDRESGAGRVFAALTQPGIPWDLYLGHLKRWIEFNSRNKESTFFYCAWLAGAERKPMLIQNGIRAWLENNAEWKDAYCVLNDWLKHDDASTEIVQAGYKRWMAVHGKSPQAKIVSKNWDTALERERKALYKEIMSDKR